MNFKSNILSMASGYVDLGYKPRQDDLVCLFYLEPSEGSTFEKAAEQVTAESSIGTWTDVSTMNPNIRERLQPHIFLLDEKQGLARVAYPLDLFELDNIPQILSSIAGNIYGMKAIDNLRLLDFTLPEKIVRSFEGPSFGIKGIRKLLSVRDRPLVGTIIKPKVGLPTEDHARVAFESWVGGCDIVKDDENLTNQEFNPFEERVLKTLRMRDRAEKESGERKVYMPNVTAETEEMISRMEFVKNEGGEYVMIDVITLGFGALQTAVKYAKDLGLVVHAHRAMHAALTRNKKHGITMLALAKLYRLIGTDQLHVGTAVGKMEGPANEVVSIRDEITLDDVPEYGNRLKQEWYGLKTVFPVCSGGLHAGHIPELMEIMGEDIIIQAGGGVHGHPDGTLAGAQSLRQAVDAVMKDVSLEEYARSHVELSRVLEKMKK
ncbi:MAG: type III ribulose-bisphosphate carboxylase [Candidatus Altiarchaeota archaeon]|nr:type III ribulose-bisphosphate carboxylase [Candidatus Altiarchaeota archaeon]